jgi:chorismate synthase
MAGSTFNEIFKVTTFGESHGAALGCVIDGCPAGLEISEDEIQVELDKRRPGQSDVSTPRDEKDKVQILSGVFEGKTTGTPIAMVIFNTDQRSKDYGNIKDLFRPAHADFTFDAKFGHRDYRGGGRASGRETAARVMAGAIALKLLAKEGIEVQAYTKSIHSIEAETVDFDVIENNVVRCADANAAKVMEELIIEKKEAGDSVGGVIECQALGLPAGIGSPVFDKLEARLAQALMSIGSVKGFEMGSGFAATYMFGSEHNDNVTGVKDGRLEFENNFSGGTLGGISTGAPLVCRAAFKPTSSILQPQTGVDRKGNLVEFDLEGRHDPCIVPRAVPVVRSMLALVILDELLKQKLVKMN